MKHNRTQLLSLKIKISFNDNFIRDLVSQFLGFLGKDPSLDLFENRAFPSCLKASGAVGRLWRFRVPLEQWRKVGNGTRSESGNPVIYKFSHENVSFLNIITAGRPWGQPFSLSHHCTTDKLRWRSGWRVEAHAILSTPFRGKSCQITKLPGDEDRTRIVQTLVCTRWCKVYWVVRETLSLIPLPQGETFWTWDARFSIDTRQLGSNVQIGSKCPSKWKRFGRSESWRNVKRFAILEKST